MPLPNLEPSLALGFKFGNALSMMRLVDQQPRGKTTGKSGGLYMIIRSALLANEGMRLVDAISFGELQPSFQHR